VGVRGRVICTDISNGASVSLFIPIWVNGHRKEYPLGTQLSLLLALLPEAERPSTLGSVRVDRAIPNGGFARVIFPNTSEGPVQVVLWLVTILVGVYLLNEGETFDLLRFSRERLLHPTTI
jgi:hypothetical protein